MLQATPSGQIQILANLKNCEASASEGSSFFVNSSTSRHPDDPLPNSGVTVPDTLSSGPSLRVMKNRELATGENQGTDAAESASVFWGTGEMAALMRSLDWSQTAVGRVSSWPQSLKTAVRIILMSRYPMFVWWGRELVNLYNDPYCAFLGTKHPAALGKSARDVWAEIWEQIGPRADAVLLHGESTFDEALLLLMARHGYLEETYFTFSYSPLPDDAGHVGGLFCAVTEETEQVIGERRLRLLRGITAEMAQSRTPAQVCESARRCLSDARRDLPFTLIYLFDDAGKNLVCTAQTGFVGDHVAAPAAVSLEGAEEVWPLRAAVESSQPVLLNDLATRFSNLPTGDWNEPPECAILLPIAQQGQPRPLGVFVAGLNRHREFSDDYRGFVELLANQIGAGIANATAYETERRRAEALAELDRAKTKFFSNVSHEFRTPLTLMLGPLAEVLPEARERLTPEKHEQLVMARRNGLRLLKLVNNLLDFSRLEAGRLQATYQPTDLCQLTEDISSIFRSAMEKAGLVFSVECGPISGPIYVDRDLWEKIVLNLLSNAFKFTFEGSVTVRLKEVGDAVELSVSDTGTGIPQEELPRIFERFHRIENSRSRTFEGTGIGLALVQELATLHGGTASVTSAEGRGSTFTITIPLGSAHLPADRIQPASMTASAAPLGETYIEEAQRWLPESIVGAADLREISDVVPSAAPKPTPELILLADDNADMRDYLARLLRQKYRVHTAPDGLKAVEAARQWRPDLVLADVMMPGLDGFGLLRAIRSDAALRSTPVILLSGRAGEESRVEGLHAGANDYLVKPFTARELLARIDSHLAISREQNNAAVTAQRLAAIVESADDAIISKDLNGIVTSWNGAAERIFGYTAEEMIGRSITTIIPPELQADEQRILATIGRGEGIDHFETVRLTKSGERVEVSLTISPLRDDKGRIVGAAKIARDITQRKKIESVLRTSEKLASVGRLAATVAHEINNPLEAVTNFIYLAKKAAGSQDVCNYLAGAEEELERVAHVAKQTLGFYRGSKGAAPVKVGAEVSSLASVFMPRVRNKAIDFRQEIKAEIEILAIPAELRQLVANLLSNSIDAVSNHGHVRVRVAPAREPGGQHRSGVRITVADSGPGISRELRSMLFQPFFTTKKEVGTGLGLWICHEIVEKQGGSIRMRSSTRPGRSGTVFSVFLPVEAAAKETTEQSLKQPA